ncbi:phage integrase family protein [Herbaspirillum sp. CF444]|uniref:hypothetical protein n=1 Tax=Herbaspirillum sp. CF444 TaxID=1144319 RepID=UPI00027240B7|nr:hypothetical protein [Herbaspirillum sp. CF444]EJL81201.1 phage integrase family protein [Herbaspirillum sp. CF444]
MSNLTFPMLEYGLNQAPWDLCPLLYRGGAGEKVKKALQKIKQGHLGDVIPERVELVSQLHEILVGDLIGGGSRFSANNKIVALRSFFTWCDERQEHLSLETVTNVFIHWADHLLHRHRVESYLTQASLYDLVRLTATMFDRVLGRESSLIKSTRIRKPIGKGRSQTTKSDNQNLKNTFDFGHVLADICNGLTWEATTGALPVCITLRTGQVLKQWSGLTNLDKPTTRIKKPPSIGENKKSEARRAAWNQDLRLSTRSPLLNLRIESELLMFIAQTGMNLQQAHTLRVEQFHYTSHLDGYQVRSYKNRRNGEVLFEIYANYRDWFERYLAWRAQWFPDESDGLLFPLVRTGGRIKEAAPQFVNLVRVCKTIGVQIIRPGKLRKTRINWLLRESQNPEQVAELAQHTMETLIRVYVDPHPQIAMVEITRFHQQTDPSISSPAPGRCVAAIPEVIHEIPQSAPRPDCINAAGCLFCTQHRDIESEDHVWSLTSLSHLKSLELALYRPPIADSQAASRHPALITIERLTAKLKFFEESSHGRKRWVDEARARIAEGEYHPAWDGFIRLAELNNI